MPKRSTIAIEELAERVDRIETRLRVVEAAGAGEDTHDRQQPEPATPAPWGARDLLRQTQALFKDVPAPAWRQVPRTAEGVQRALGR